jgi:hypothetical protein
MSASHWATGLPLVALLLGLTLASVSFAAVPADYKGTPYKGVAQEIPGRVELENFDEGGFNVAFNTQHHEGDSSGKDYRTGDKPQICVTNGAPSEQDHFVDGTRYPSADKESYYIGYARPGDWVKCTVNVKKAGIYRVNTTAANDTKVMTFSLRFNNVLKATVKSDGTGSYHIWKVHNDICVVELEEGLQVMQFQLGSEPHMNYDYMEFVYDPTATPTVTATPPTATPAAKEFFKVEAEKADPMTGAQLENGGTDVGYFNAGSILGYKGLEFDAAANAINMVIASGSDGGKFELRLDAADGQKIGEFTVASTGGWTSWQDITVPITIVTGTHTLFIVGAAGDGICNFDRFSLVLLKAAAPKAP